MGDRAAYSPPGGFFFLSRIEACIIHSVDFTVRDLAIWWSPGPVAGRHRGPLGFEAHRNAVRIAASDAQDCCSGVAAVLSQRFVQQGDFMKRARIRLLTAFLGVAPAMVGVVQPTNTEPAAFRLRRLFR
jgi:hypothetical protein